LRHSLPESRSLAESIREKQLLFVKNVYYQSFFVKNRYCKDM